MTLARAASYMSNMARSHSNPLYRPGCLSLTSYLLKYMRETFTMRILGIDLTTALRHKLEVLIL